MVRPAPAKSQSRPASTPWMTNEPLPPGAPTKLAVEGGKAWYIAPNYNPTGKAGWEAIRNYASMLKALYPTIKILDSEPFLAKYPSGGSIEVHTGDNWQAKRAAGLNHAFLDEWAFMQIELWHNAIRPMLANSQGGATFASSPWGKNHHYDMFMQCEWITQSEPVGSDETKRRWVRRRNKDGYRGWEAFHFVCYDNPLIPMSEWEDIKATTPELQWRTEYMADFVEGGGIVFRGVADAARIEVGSLDYDPAHVYVMGVDWGRVNDNTVISVIDSTTRQQVFEDAFTDIGYDTQRARIIAAYEQWKPGVIYAEENSMGGPNVEALQKDGLPVIPFNTNGSSKGPLIDGLSLAIERGMLEILNDAELKRELTDYEMTPLPKGGYRYGAPSGRHDDRVIALALAWHGCNARASVGTLQIGTAPKAIADLFTSFG